MISNRFKQYQTTSPDFPTFAVMNPEELKKAVRKAFTEYLEKHDHRKTEERFAVLDEVYSLNDHFDIDHLYSQIKAKQQKNVNFLKVDFS